MWDAIKSGEFVAAFFKLLNWTVANPGLGFILIAGAILLFLAWADGKTQGKMASVGWKSPIGVVGSLVAGLLVVVGLLHLCGLIRFTLS